MNNTSDFLFSTNLSKNTELILSDLLKQATITVKNSLKKLAKSSDFDSILQLAFGNNIDPTWLQQSWTAEEFVFPEIEVVNRSEINNANGAFTRKTNKIYLAQEFLLANINNLDAVTNVVLEEYGHFVDILLNFADATGDEGAIFATLAQGKKLSEGELQQLRKEDDSAVVIRDKKEVVIEQNQAITELVNVANDGSKGNNYAENPAISANGRYVVFESDADNLVANDTNLAKDIFLRDLVSGTTQLVSLNNEGSQSNNNSENPVISADGRYVAFESDANNLVANDTNFAKDIFVRDLVNNTTQRVNLANDGSQTSISSEPSISADGRYVAFTSYASNLIAEDNNNTADIFIRDLVNGTTQRVSLTDKDLESNNYSLNPSISGDGRYVAFESRADNLVVEDNNKRIDIFVRDLTSSTTQRVSVNSEDIESNFSSKNPSLSADGRYIVFESLSYSLVAEDNNFSKDIFIRDLVNGTTQRVSVNSEGIEGNGNSLNPSISDDGRYVTFSSDASNLVVDDSNLNQDIFVRDLVEDTTERVNLSENDSEAFGLSDSPSISDGGRYIAFQSDAEYFISGETDSSIDIFVRDRGDSFSIPNEEDNDLPDPPEENNPINPSVEITSLEQNTDRSEVTINYNAFDADSEAKIQLFYDDDNQGNDGILIADNLVETDGVGNFIWNTEDIPSGGYYVYAKIFDDNNSPVLNYSEHSIQITEAEVTEDRSTIELVSIIENSNNNYDAVISNNGRYVVFKSDADISDKSIPNLFVRDLVNNTIKQITNNLDIGLNISENAYYSAVFSADGRYVKFAFYYRDQDTRHIKRAHYVYDLIEDTTELFDSKQHNIDNYDYTVSANGRYKVFLSNDNDLVKNDLNPNPDIFVEDLVNNTIRIVSVDNNGVSAYGVHQKPRISSNGRYVFFESDADNLVADDNNRSQDIFVRDLVEGTTQLLSVNSEGSEGNKDSENPSISPDGRYITFQSKAKNFAENDADDYTDIFVHDRGESFSTLGTTEVILPEPDDRANQPITKNITSNIQYLSSKNPIISDDGNSVIFERKEGTTSNNEGIWIAEQTDNFSYDSKEILEVGKNLDVSGDGSIVFATDADKLVLNDTGDFTDIFIKTNSGFRIFNGHLTKVSGGVRRVSITNEGFQANSNSNSPRISHNGRYVVFTSYATNLVSDDTNGFQNIFVRDLINNTTQIVNIANDGTQANKDSYEPIVSANGRYVVFSSDADNLVPNDNNKHRDIFIRDLVKGTTELVNVMDDASQTNWMRGNYDLSEDGRYVVFSSVVSEVPDNYDHYVHIQYIFIRDLENDKTQKLALTNDDSVPYISVYDSDNNLKEIPLPDGSVPRQDSYSLRISNSGRFVFFESSSDIFVAEELNYTSDSFSRSTDTSDIFVHDLTTETNELISVPNNIYSDLANGNSFDYDISPDGRYVAFHSDASNLVGGDLNGRKDLFLRDRGELSSATISPDIEITSLEQNANENTVEISFSPFFLESETQIKLFYDNDNQNSDGILITEIVDTANKTARETSFVWDTANVPSGDYYIYAMILDRDNSSSVSYSSSKVQIAETVDSSGTKTADLSITQTVDLESVGIREKQTYTVTVTNNSDDDSQGVNLTYTLPEGATFVSATINPSEQSDNNLTFDLGDLAKRESTNVEITVNASNIVGDSFSNAVVTSNTYDPDSTNDFASLTTTVTDKRSLPGLSIDDVSVAEGNDSRKELIFTVSLSEASSETITVDYATKDLIAIAGQDYIATNGTLEFAPGETEETITVEVIGDSEVEEDETFLVNLSNASNSNSALSNNQATAVIENDDFAQAQDSPSLNTPIYRFQSLNTSGTYLYAAGAEAENIRKNFAASFVEEGMAFNTAIKPHDELIPLFRFQSKHLPGTYLFVGEDERNSINADPNLSNSFTEEGIGFYVYGAGYQKGATFSRFQNLNVPGTYLYATGAEADNIRDNFPNFLEEGPAFEVVI